MKNKPRPIIIGHVSLVLCTIPYHLRVLDITESIDPLIVNEYMFADSDNIQNQSRDQNYPVIIPLMHY